MTARPTALVVGARGLGAHLAAGLGALGHRVVIVSRTAAQVEAAAAAVTQAGGLGVPCVADLHDEPALARAVSLCTEGGQPLDLVIAAQTSGAPFRSIPVLALEDDFLLRGVRGYPLATLRLLRVVGPVLLAQGRGTFLQIGTGGGARPRPGFTHLAMPQHALRVLVLAAAREWKDQGVHVAWLALEGQLAQAGSEGYVERHGLDHTLPPEAVLQAVRFLHEQPPRAWTHELSLRPSASEWT